MAVPLLVRLVAFSPVEPAWAGTESSDDEVVVMCRTGGRTDGTDEKTDGNGRPRPSRAAPPARHLYAAARILLCSLGWKLWGYVKGAKKWAANEQD